MRRMLPLIATAAFIAGSVGHAAAQPKTFTPREENIEELPASPGRDETFYTCTACHNFKLVAQQGMSRQRWNDTLTWMTERQGMPAIEGADRELILDYLSTHYPQTEPAARGWQNPFTNQ